MEELEKLKAGLHKVWEGEMLIKPREGIVLIITTWSDGSKTEREVPKYPILPPVDLLSWWF